MQSFKGGLKSKNLGFIVKGSGPGVQCLGLRAYGFGIRG